MCRPGLDPGQRGSDALNTQLVAVVAGGADVDIGHAGVVQAGFGLGGDRRGGDDGTGAVDDAVLGGIAPYDVVGGGEDFGDIGAAARFASISAEEDRAEFGVGLG